MGTKRSAEELRACIKLVEERMDGVKDKHVHWEQINVYGEQLTELYEELREAEEHEKIQNKECQARKSGETQESLKIEEKKDNHWGGGGVSCTDPHWRWM